MGRVEVLLALYRLSLSAPSEDRITEVQGWLQERHELLQRLGAGVAPPAPEDAPGASIERALTALILHADGYTFERLQRARRRLQGLLRGRPAVYR